MLMNLYPLPLNKLGVSNSFSLFFSKSRNSYGVKLDEFSGVLPHYLTYNNFTFQTPFFAFIATNVSFTWHVTETVKTNWLIDS